MGAHIDLRLFASLKTYVPPGAEHLPIESGETVEALMTRLGVPLDDVQLIFINGIKGEMASSLFGGERVGVFPPVGGG